MWYAIFAGAIFLEIAGGIYLISRFYKTEILKRLVGERRVAGVLLAAAIVIAIGAGSYVTIGPINTAIVIIHLLAIWLIADIINFFVQKKWKKASRYDFVALLTIIFFLSYMGYGWYSAHHVAVTQYPVASSKNVNKLKVVQITDSHVGATFDGEGFAKHIETIQKENPDVVVVTGDFVDDDTTKEDMIRSSEALGTLKTKYGVYFVFGNHDKGYADASLRGFDTEDIKANLKKNNVVVMEDDIVTLPGNYTLIGRQDKSEEQRGGSRASMKSLMKGVNKNSFSIVLDHQPGDSAAQQEEKVDLVLSGHTHGGQFFPFNKMGEWTGLNDMTYGIRKQGDTTFETSSGISDWALKFKTGCKSEYVVLEIQKK